MRLGFYLESILVADSKGNIYSNDTYMLLLPKLITEELSISVISRKQAFDESLAHYSLDQRIDFTALTGYNSILDLLKIYPKYVRMNSKKIDNFLESIDHLVVTTAGPLSILFLERAIKKNIPCTILVRANSRKTIPQRFSGIKKQLASLVINYIEFRIDKLCKKNNLSVIALGKQLHEYYAKLSTNCISFASSKYTLKDIISEKDLKPINWDGQINLLFVGRLVVNKGLMELISALSKLKKINWKLSIVGSGEYESTLKKTINQLNLQDKITLKGNITFGEELKNIYKDHDVLILPSYFEGLPQVIFEGMSNGCLVLATEVGGIPGVITHLQNGILFRPKSMQEILLALGDLPQLKNVDEIRQAALETAKEYAQENQINNFYKALK